MEFHVSRAARERYNFDERLFNVTGNVVFPDFAASRRFAQKMNELRAAEIAADPGRTARAGDVNAMGLIDEVLHTVIDLYREQRDPQLMSGALKALEAKLGTDKVQATLEEFTEHFPTVAAYRGDVSAPEYLRGSTDGRPNREIALEELLLNWLANENPARERYEELFDDDPIREADRTAYDEMVDALADHFREGPGFGPEQDDLVSLLQKPSLEAPESLAGQIKWLREKWGFALGRLSDRLAIGLDVLKEDERAEWMRFHPTDGGPAVDAGTDAAALHGFEDLAPEEEHFSQDLHWMPRLVLVAKSTYVWLDQLSKQYRRSIERLDQIPDEELDTLAARGFSGLWLIGLWERSRASQRIKQLRGQSDAVASAYSLYDYEIAVDLGGEEAYQNLRGRAWQRGIRLASDMVPNHMGIDSRWVVEHPDWFISRPDSPYPVYSFNGPDLSTDERVGIFLEDHYYDGTDAAVVFKRVDRWSGEERFVYHGNDGTSYPWNDTAQLDYLKPEVREAVIQTILAVARRFPVIRFDAAMVLAKRHVERLWYPEPGEGGAIPSRAESAMSKREFNRRMPEEFWRELVDRVAAEAPDTLLLAEAFWLMEGYFVRTLGMHRVYNSAFMNMMRDEKNAEYRLVVKNTLEFDPQILKRYVNFMNNPDEKTAVEQFGVDDKYFGVATVMATMPGLPMVGHGQVEGFTEKYGMEYRRAKHDESVNEGLVRRHEEQIFPLLHRRELFAEVDGFALYDFESDGGGVNEDVFAYSNRGPNGERTLVVYHNRFGSTSGWLRRAAITGKSLGEGLGLSPEEGRFLVLQDHRSKLEFLRPQSVLAGEGLYLELDAYKTHVFLELSDVVDEDGRWRRLADRLGGRGVPSLDEELAELEAEPVSAPFARIVKPEVAKEAQDAAVAAARAVAGVLVDRLAATAADIGSAARDLAGFGPSTPPDEVEADFRIGLLTALRLAQEPHEGLPNLDDAAWLALLGWLAGRGIGGGPEVEERQLLCRRRYRQWRLDLRVVDAFAGVRLDEQHARRAADALAAILGSGMWRPGSTDVTRVIRAWLADDDARQAIGVNRYEGVEWFDAAAFDRFADWTTWVGAVRLAEYPESYSGSETGAIAWVTQLASQLKGAAQRAGYRVDRLVETLQPSSSAARGPTTK